MNYLKINWLKFILYNYFYKCRIIRKNKCFLVPYFKTSIKLIGNSKLYVNGNIHIGQYSQLSKRNRTIIRLENNASMKTNGHISILRGGVIFVNGGKLLLESGAIGSDTFINCVNSIHIGNNFLISRDVIVRDNDGHFVLRQNYCSSKSISIGDNVWLCERVTILKGSSIGNNVIVGFGAIVKGKINKNVVASFKSELLNYKIDGWSK